MSRFDDEGQTGGHERFVLDAGAEFDDRIADWELGARTEPCSVVAETERDPATISTPLGDLHFLNLRGAPDEMHRELGRRTSSFVDRRALSHADDHLHRFAARLGPSFLKKPGKWLVEQRFVDPLTSRIPDSHRMMLNAFCEGIDESDGRALKSQLFWDVRASLIRSSVRRIRTLAKTTRHQSLYFDSFSAVVPDGTDAPLHLRWLDNAAADHWSQSTTVAFFHPHRGIPYALVTTLGFAAGLPAGMNRAGLSATVEPSPGEKTGGDGTLCGLLIHDVLGNAHTIEEAVSILRQHSSMIPWRWVFCEGDTGRCAVFDVAESVQKVAFDGPAFWTGPSEADPADSPPGRVERRIVERADLLDDFIAGWTPPPDDAVFTTLQELTCEAGSPTDRGFLVGGLSNVQSVAFEPRRRRMWVATGDAPVCRRWYVPLTFGPGNVAERGGLDPRVRPLKPGGDFEKTDAGRAVEHLARARRLHRNGEPPQRVLIAVEHAVALDSNRPFYHVLAGLTALEADRHRRAEGAFRRAIDQIDDDPRRAEVEVYLGWALDLQGRRKETRRIYARIARGTDAELEVRRWARDAKRSRFRTGDLDDIDIDFFAATALR